MGRVIQPRKPQCWGNSGAINGFHTQLPTELAAGPYWDCPCWVGWNFSRSPFRPWWPASSRYDIYLSVLIVTSDSELFVVLLPLCSPGPHMKTWPSSWAVSGCSPFGWLPSWPGLQRCTGWSGGPCGPSSLWAPIQHSTEGLQAGFSVQVSGPWASLMPALLALPSHGWKALLKTVVIADQPAGRSFLILIHFLFFKLIFIGV